MSTAIAALRAAVASYGRHACSELAAAIAYRILFALVPFVALLAAVLGAVLPDSAREDVIAWLLGGFPGTTVQSGVEQELASSGTLLSVAGLIAFGALIWTASGMTRSLRVALAVIWEFGERPAYLRAKLRDVVALGVLAALVLCVFALSLVTQVAVHAGSDLADALGFGRGTAWIATGAELLVTLVATFAALLLVYRLAAPVPLALAALWPTTLMTAVAIDAGIAGYAFYLVRIASFSTIYGPLGAVLAFLALVYLLAMLVLFGAELILATAASSGRGEAPRAAPP